MPEKTYYSRTQMCRFPFSWGTEATFIYGRYITDKPNEQRELDAIIPPLGNNPNIYTQESINLAGNIATIEQHPIVAQSFSTDAEVATAERNLLNMGLKVRVQQEAGPVRVVIPNPTDVNNLSIDPVLQQEVLGQANIQPLGPQRIIGPGANQQFFQNQQSGLNIPQGNLTSGVPTTQAPITPTIERVGTGNPTLDAIRAQAAANLAQQSFSGQK